MCHSQSILAFDLTFAYSWTKSEKNRQKVNVVYILCCLRKERRGVTNTKAKCTHLLHVFN